MFVIYNFQHHFLFAFEILDSPFLELSQKYVASATMNDLSFTDQESSNILYMNQT